MYIVHGYQNRCQSHQSKCQRWLDERETDMERRSGKIIAESERERDEEKYVKNPTVKTTYSKSDRSHSHSRVQFTVQLPCLFVYLFIFYYSFYSVTTTGGNP